MATTSPSNCGESREAGVAATTAFGACPSIFHTTFCCPPPPVVELRKRRMTAVDNIVKARTQLLHVEDSRIWVELAEYLIRDIPDIEYQGCAPTLAAARQRCADQPPDILLLDLMLPDGDGLDLAGELRARDKPIRILACTLRSDDYVLHRVHQLRLEGLVWKERLGFGALRQSLEIVLAGGYYVCDELSDRWRKLVSHPEAWFKILSNAELGLLPMLGLGLSDVDIARRTGLSFATIHSHRHHIMRKLELHKNSDLVIWAHRKGFVSPARVLLAK